MCLNPHSMFVFHCRYTASLTGHAPQHISWEDTTGWRAITDKLVEMLRSDTVIRHLFWTQQEDKGVGEELMCQSKPVHCPGRWVHQSHKRAHRQDVVMVLGDSPGDRYTFSWVTARQIGPNRISWPGCPPLWLWSCSGGDTPDTRALC